VAVLGLGDSPYISTRGGTFISESVIFFFLKERKLGVNRLREYTFKRLNIRDNSVAF